MANATGQAVDGTAEVVRQCATCGGDVFRKNTCYCKKCWTEKAKGYYHADPEKHRAKRREYHRSNPDVAARAWYKRKLKRFNVTEEWFLATLEAQGNVCAICGGLGDSPVLVIDHDHSCCPQQNGSCGQCVRGLLCNRCNLMLGCAGDRTDVLKAAINYLA